MLDELNNPVVTLVHQVATELFSRPTPAKCELVTTAVIDLPHAVVRRHLVASTLHPATANW